jgi:hypothetical protein
MTSAVRMQAAVRWIFIAWLAREYRTTERR